MTFTYTWANPDNTALVRSDNAVIPVAEENRDYREFLASGATAAPYVAPAPPAPPAPPTAAEKLAAAGLTVEELKALLAT